MYSTISQSTIITSPIGFNIALTNLDTRLKQHCINVVPTLRNVVLTLCNVVSTLFQCRALKLYQGRATLKIRRWILFYFQRRINVISTLIHNAETTLIRCWNVRSGSPEKNTCIQIETVLSLRRTVKLNLWTDEGSSDSQKSVSFNSGVMW